MTVPTHAVDRPDEAQVFVALAVWLAPRLPRDDLAGFVDWLGGWLKPEVRQRIRHRLPLNEPARIEAEKALVALMAESLERRAVRQVWSEAPERSVDWLATWVEAGLATPTRYRLSRAYTTVDRSLTRALRGLALELARSLSAWGWTDDHRRREEALKLAARKGDERTQVFRSQHLKRLESGTEAARSFVRAWRRTSAIWRRSITDPDVKAELLKLLRFLAPGAANVNDLLELIALVEIVRAAVEASPGRWRLLPIKTMQPGKKPEMVLARGNLRCRVTKGRPRALVAGKWEAVTDTLVATGQAWGLGSRGNLPDIVLTFWRDEHPDGSVSVLGDSKRNYKDRGRDYLAKSLEVAAVYTVSYREAVRARFSKDPTSPFVGPVQPIVTLFTYQSLRKPDPEWFSAEPAAIKPPWAEHFEYGRHFACDAPSGAVAHWLDHLAAQAEKCLLDEQGCRAPE